MTQLDYAAKICFRFCKGVFATLLEKRFIKMEHNSRRFSVPLRRSTTRPLENWRWTVLPEKRITQVEFPTGQFSPQQPPPRKRVAAYARVSTMKDAQENNLESQREYFTEYIQRHPDWVFAGMYTDDGISGLSIRRRDGLHAWWPMPWMVKSTWLLQSPCPSSSGTPWMPLQPSEVWKPPGWRSIFKGKTSTPWTAPASSSSPWWVPLPKRKVARFPKM